MAVIKTKFNSKKRFSILSILIIALLMIGAGFAGFWLSDSGTVNKMTNRTSAECTEVYDHMQDFIKQTNYWMNSAQACERELWTCQLLLKQLSVKPSDSTSNMTVEAN